MCNYFRSVPIFYFFFLEGSRKIIKSRFSQSCIKKNVVRLVHLVIVQMHSLGLSTLQVFTIIEWRFLIMLDSPSTLISCRFVNFDSCLSNSYLKLVVSQASRLEFRRWSSKKPRKDLIWSNLHSKHGYDALHIVREYGQM